MNACLSVKHTRCIQGQPLAVVDGLPGGSAELRPGELRSLALALIYIARDCEHATPRDLMTRRKYALQPRASQPASTGGAS